MAMEKLILKSVMYGADKIPDHWFEKLPGNYFEEKEHEKEQNKNGGNNNNRQGNQRDGQRQGNNDNDSGYRSDGNRRRSRRNRSSYDGGADDDYDRGRDDGRRRRRSRSRRRRHSLDDDRYGYDDGYGRPPRDDRYNDRRASRYPRQQDYGGNTRFNGNPPPSFEQGPGPSPPVGGMAGVPPYPQTSAPSPIVTQSPQYNQAPQFTQQQARGPGASNEYVPYADIYHQPSPRQPPVPYSPTYPNDATQRGPIGPTSPTYYPIAPPPQGYQQNQDAQQAPTAAAAGAGAIYTGQPGFVNQDVYHSNGYDPRNPRKGRDGYGENNHPSSSSQDRSSRRDGSPSRGSNGDRRTRSERREDEKSKGSRGGKFKQGGKFDVSKPGLGYGAVGGAAGGIIASNFGHGPVPTLLGAGLGALGANAFEARERYVDLRDRPRMQPSTQSSPTVRRKYDEREEEFRQKGLYDRQKAKREKEQGYHSD